MATLERAIKIALEAHAGQVDKAGEAYILHPLRLMLQMETQERRIAAVLHDVVEDSNWTFDDLKAEGFLNGVLDALEYLTKKEGENYFDFVERAAKNPIARDVKIADVKDNMNISRISNPTKEDHERIEEKYKPALEILQSRKQ
jgi:(p)ppGpp synthase/HD superfamily hydrolase